jgi:hypothetical protein
MTGRLHVVGLDNDNQPVGVEALAYTVEGQRRVAVAITDESLAVLAEFHLDPSAARPLAAFLTEGLT